MTGKIIKLRKLYFMNFRIDAKHLVNQNTIFYNHHIGKHLVMDGRKA